MVEILNPVITILLDRLAATAVLVLPAGCYAAWPMFYTQKLRHFALYCITRTSLGIPAASAADARERSFHSDGKLPRLYLKCFGLRDYKRPVLCHGERLALGDTNLRIGDTHLNFGRCIAPQEGNAPGSQENRHADAYRTDSNCGRPLE